MTDEQEQAIVKRFADVLHDVPHRPNCLRTKGVSHKCSCDIGDYLTKVFDPFQDLIILLREN